MASSASGAGAVATDPPEGMRKWKFAVIWNEDGEKWGGMDKMYPTAFADNTTDEPWVTFSSALEGKVPSKEDIAKFDGFVVSGSHHSAYDDLPWIHEVNTFFKQAHEAYQSSDSDTPRVIGICFGAQLAAMALGGHTAKNDEEGSFVLKSESMTLTEAAATKPYMKAMQLGSGDESKGDDAAAGPVVNVLESHGDRVHKLPEGAEVLATTPTAPFELYCVGDHLLAIQGHPEFEYTQIVDTILPARELPEAEAAAIRDQVLGTPLHNTEVREAFRHFLTRGEKWAKL